MSGRLGSPNAGRIPSSAFYASTGNISAIAADAFFKLPYKTDLIQENVQGADGATVQWSAATSLDEAFQIAETYLELIVTLFAEADDACYWVDSPTAGALSSKEISDTVRQVDTLLGFLRVFPTVYQLMKASDINKFVPNIQLTDGVNLTFSQDLACTRVVTVTEPYNWFLESEYFDLDFTYKPTVTENFRITDNLRNIWAQLLSEAFTFSEIIGYTRGWNVLEQLGFDTSTLTTYTLGASFADRVRLVDTLARFISGDVTESLSFSLTAAPKFFLDRKVNEGANVTDTPSNTFILRLEAKDNVNIDDIDALRFIFNPTLLDTVNASATYIAPNDTITTWAINTSTGAVSSYTNYAFNSFAAMGNNYFGASETGLYSLVGEKDQAADIIAHLKSGFAQFGGAHLSSFAAAYLGLRGEGDWVLKLVTGDGKEYVYSVVGQNMQTTKIRLGKGLRARYFAFELLSTGQDFDLDTVEFIPIIAKRRV